MPYGFTSEATTVTGGGSALVLVRAPAGLSPGDEVITTALQDPRVERYGLIFREGNQLQTVDEAGFVPVLFDNPKVAPVTLAEMIPVCCFQLRASQLRVPDTTLDIVERTVKIWPGLYKDTTPVGLERLNLLRRLLTKRA